MSWQVTPERAHEFAIIRAAGVPDREAIRYVYPEATADDIKAELPYFIRDGLVQQAILAHQGKPWHAMSLEEQLQTAIDKHYREVAWYLYQHNYAELDGRDRAKADTCRTVIETKIAGLAGTSDALTRFFDDLQSGRVALLTPRVPRVA